MWIGMIAAVLVPAQVPEQGINGGARVDGSASIDAPVRQYPGCLGSTLERASQKQGAVHADGMRRLVAQTLATCAPVRGQAREQALILIANDVAISEKGRAQEVDRTFAALDHVSMVWWRR